MDIVKAIWIISSVALSSCLILLIVSPAVLRFSPCSVLFLVFVFRLLFRRSRILSRYFRLLFGQECLLGCVLPLERFGCSRFRFAVYSSAGSAAKKLGVVLRRPAPACPLFPLKVRISEAIGSWKSQSLSYSVSSVLLAASLLYFVWLLQLRLFYLLQLRLGLFLLLCG